MHVCCVSLCVFVVRYSVGGRAQPCPQHHCMEADSVMSTSCSVQVCGYCSVVSTTRSGEVNPIFAWEVLFAKEGSEICLVYM